MESGMAKKPNEPLEALSQRFDIWQVDARLATTTLQAGDRSVRPWMTVVVSRTDDHVLGFEFSHEEPTFDQVWQTLLKAIQEPAAGEPHRPTEVQLTKEAWATGLRPRLQSINIECQVVETLDQIDDVFEELGGHLPEQREPGLLDMPGVTPEAVESFFDAAALFFEQAPWSKTGERPIQVECSQFESGPWYAIVMGQGGMAKGLVLYDSLETLQRIQQGNLSAEENARLSAGLTVVFGEKDDLVPADIEAFGKHGWRVATPNAYPSVYRMEPGLSMRPPLAWELRLLDGCLRGIPEFVRKKTRRLEPLPIIVPTAGGDLQLVMSWVAAQ
jgi:uncharacterized protein DUF6930